METKLKFAIGFAVAILLVIIVIVYFVKFGSSAQKDSGDQNVTHSVPQSMPPPVLVDASAGPAQPNYIAQDPNAAAPLASVSVKPAVISAPLINPVASVGAAVPIYGSAKVITSPSLTATPTSLGAGPGTYVRYPNTRFYGGEYATAMGGPGGVGITGPLPDVLNACSRDSACWGVLHSVAAAELGVPLGMARMYTKGPNMPPFIAPHPARSDFYFKV